MNMLSSFFSFFYVDLLCGSVDCGSSVLLLHVPCVPNNLKLACEEYRLFDLAVLVMGEAV